MPKVNCRDCNKQCVVNSLQCSACSQWLHIECTGVTVEKYELISSIINMEQIEKKKKKKKQKDNMESAYHWYCKFCNKTVSDMSKVIGTLDTRLGNLEATVDEVKTDLVDVKSKINHKCDTEQVNQLIKNKTDGFCDEEKVKGIIKDNEQSTDEKNFTLSDSVKELEDRQVRRTKLLLYNIEEINSNLKDEINRNNADRVKELLQLCAIQVDENILTADNITRLGKRENIGTKPRPILVDFKCTDIKREFFSKFIRCVNQSGDDKLKKIRLAHDLTKLQRTEEQRLITDAKDLTEKNVGKSYKVRGPTWDRKVMEIFH